MKKKLLVKVFMVSLVAIGILWGCQKDELQNSNEEIGLKSAQLDINDSPCIIEYQLIAGQKYPIGTIKMTVIDENLEVEYILDPGYVLMNTHLWVGNDPTKVPGGLYNPSPGLFKFNDYQKTGNVYIIPLSDIGLNCGDHAYIFAHATVGNEEVWGTKTNTAWSNVNNNKKGSWGSYSEFEVSCCEPPASSSQCYEAETAWAEGSRYVTKGNWATYTTYSGVEKTVNLFAGQTKPAGTVKFSAPNNGQVTISIHFNYGWQFQNIQEYLKVQDYISAPSGNPEPGQFQWKTSVSNSIVVPVNSFYGVHVDVEGLVICD